MVDVKKLLEEKNKELTGGEKLEFPFEKLVVDQTEGKFRKGGVKNDEGELEGAEYFDEVELILLKKYSEYIHFDPEEERITKKTTIETSATQCRELYSKVPVQELKDAGYDMKFIAHYVSLLKTDKGFEPVDFITKGAVFKALLDYLSENREVSKKPLFYVLKMRLERRKKGVVIYYVPVIESREITDEEASEILKKVDETVEKFEEFRRAYNSRTSEYQEEKEETIEEDDSDVPF